MRPCNSGNNPNTDAVCTRFLNDPQTAFLMVNLRECSNKEVYPITVVQIFIP